VLGEYGSELLIKDAAPTGCIVTFEIRATALPPNVSTLDQAAGSSSSPVMMSHPRRPGARGTRRLA
jgi:hypothetical protein